MTGLSLQDKFPDLTPIRSAPSLYTMNGIGTGVYGRRDYDDETGTYVTTYCFCVLFIPLLAISAYRVADAPGGGYYFLGKTPLSLVAKGWNGLLAAAAVAGIGFGVFQSWYHSPENVARRKLAAADRLVAAGEHAAAAADYEELALGGSGQADLARERLEHWLAAPPAGATAADQHALWQVAVTLNQMAHWPAGPQSLCDQALVLAEKVADQDAKLAVGILKGAEPLDENPQASAPRRRQLLEKLHQRSPGDMDLTVQLALAVEQEGNLERCEALLTPLADKLAATEGARILGQRYVQHGKFNEAHALLAPYCESRLGQYRAAETAFESAYEVAQRSAVSELEADEAFRRRYDQAGPEEQERMVSEHVVAAIKSDPAVTRQREVLRQSSRVVPVALDFGVVQLYRAQGLADPAERKIELEKAEATFLAIGNAAGDTDEYKLNLGKVYYWLGKSAEGKKLLDEILERNAGDFQIRLAVVGTLREVGAETEARQLVEQIYNEETDEDNRYRAAGLRALLFTDIDDEIEWLNLCRVSDPSIKASLALARGNKALQDRDDATAEQELRQAAALYEGFPESSSSLNNAALCYNSLFHVRGQLADLRKAAAMLDRAVSLKPDNSTLMINAADMNFNLALAELCGEQIDLRLIRTSGGNNVLGYLYRDDAGRQQTLAQLKAQPALSKALQYFEKAILLAPKRGSNYAQAADIYSLLDDEAALARLLRQIEDAQPDTAEAVAETLKHLAGENDEKNAQSLNGMFEACRKFADHWQTAAPGEKRSRSLAAAQINVCGCLLGQGALPDHTPADPEEVMLLAAEALRSHACSVTEQMQIAARLYRTHAQLVAQNPAYRTFGDAYQRYLSSYEILLAALDRETLRPAILAHPDFKQAVALTARRFERFPKSAAADDWMLVRYADAAAVERIGQQVREDKAAALTSLIDLRLYPASGRTALLHSWRLGLEGKSAEAPALFQRLADYGVTWPQP